MRTLKAQRLKKLAAYEYQHRREIMAQIFEEAQAEAAKLAALLTAPAEKMPWEAVGVVREEYKEDDEASYFEQGVIER